MDFLNVAMKHWATVTQRAHSVAAVYHLKNSLENHCTSTQSVCQYQGTILIGPSLVLPRKIILIVRMEKLNLATPPSHL